MSTTAPGGPIVVLLGTRPEAIKLGPVILALRAAGTPASVVATGQHAELARQALAMFGIQPDRDLELMREGQTLDYVLGSAVEAIGRLFDEQRPRAVLVQGDTTSMLGAALTAFHHRIPVGHVEAGLRSGNMDHPFPEEMNRRAASVVARWHFAPTERSAANLRAEGIEAGIHVTGNTVVDALRIMRERGVIGASPATADLLDGRPYLIATAHRRESWGGGIAAIAGALREVLDAEPELHLLFITHPNPVARQPVTDALAAHPRARVLDWIAYGEFLALLDGALFAVSDSGGVQEEGATLGIPVLVTRTTTERPEGVDAGASALVGTDRETVRDAVRALLHDADRMGAMRAAGANLYGDGRAAERIVEIVGRDTAA
jgi:UDP-N-acetylglucosamine 2-epimerase (non-hydrolysing)